MVYRFHNIAIFVTANLILWFYQAYMLVFGCFFNRGQFYIAFFKLFFFWFIYNLLYSNFCWKFNKNNLYYKLPTLSWQFITIWCFGKLVVNSYLIMCFCHIIKFIYLYLGVYLNMATYIFHISRFFFLKVVKMYKKSCKITLHLS